MVMRKRLSFVLVGTITIATFIWLFPRCSYEVRTRLGLSEIVVFRELSYPDGRWILVVYDVLTAPSKGYHLLFKLRRADKQFYPLKARWVLGVDGRPQFEINWKSIDDLEIQLFGEFALEENIVVFKERVKGIDIKYTLIPEQSSVGR